MNIRISFVLAACIAAATVLAQTEEPVIKGRIGGAPSDAGADTITGRIGGAPSDAGAAGIQGRIGGAPSDARIDAIRGGVGMGSSTGFIRGSLSGDPITTRGSLNTNVTMGSTNVTGSGLTP